MKTLRLFSGLLCVLMLLTSLAGCADNNGTLKSKEENTMNVPAELGFVKPRVINMTDLGSDPDDEQSLVRMFVMSNLVDIEGLIICTNVYYRQQSQTGMDKLNKIIDAYSEALPNLQAHASGYPSVEHIRSVSVMGQMTYSMDAVGEGKDTDGSELIIAAVDKDDDRPVWINMWGGANTLAQALWKVKNTRSEAEVAEFVSKIRVYDILGQDEAGAWIVTNFPEILYIRASSDIVLGFGGDMQDNTFRNKIREIGPLGAVYPLETAGTFEGDSPAFMYQIPTGMNDPERPDWGSWGGRFTSEKVANIRGMAGVIESSYDPYYMYDAAKDAWDSITRWHVAYQNDFLARMIWSVTEKYEDANHHPIAVLNGDKTLDILEIEAKAGEEISLSADGSYDPDGDDLTYSWYAYSVPGTYSKMYGIKGNDTANASVIVPNDASGKSMHIILEIHDDGDPELYAYRRVIINVK